MDKEILTRRAFFKKALNKTLPILAGGVIAQTLFNGCKKEDEEFENLLNHRSGSGCSGSSCWSECATGCKGYTSSSSSGCSGSSCSSECSNGCQKQTQQSSTTYEKPRIGLEDYTCYATQIIVKYRIYNQTEAKVTSAKGYIGKTNPTQAVTGNVNGSLITIRFTGLTKGTTYCIKCSATGRGGTTTTETVKLPTNSI